MCRMSETESGNQGHRCEAAISPSIPEEVPAGFLRNGGEARPHGIWQHLFQPRGAASSCGLQETPSLCPGAADANKHIARPANEARPPLWCGVRRLCSRLVARRSRADSPSPS